MDKAHLKAARPARVSRPHPHGSPTPDPAQAPGGREAARPAAGAFAIPEAFSLGLEKASTHLAAETGWSPDQAPKVVPLAARPAAGAIATTDSFLLNLVARLRDAHAKRGRAAALFVPESTEAPGGSEAAGALATEGSRDVLDAFEKLLSIEEDATRLVGVTGWSFKEAMIALARWEAAGRSRDELLRLAQAGELQGRLDGPRPSAVEASELRRPGRRGWWDALLLRSLACFRRLLGSGEVPR